MKFQRLNSVITVAVAGLVAVAIALAVWWVSQDTYNAVMKNQVRTMEGLVGASESALEDYITQVRSLARTVAGQQISRDALRGDTANSDAFLKELLKENDGYWAVFLFDEKG